MINRLTDSLDFQAQALSLRSERQRLIASNIANADTPGYQARDFKFSDALNAATGNTSPAATVVTTAAGHIPTTAFAASTGANLLYASPSQTNMDSNTVDMDRERATFADNSIRYEATLRFINGNVRSLMSAITGQ
ncbi:MAG: flagellar basal body rod protein FlgB [Janthinobacterium lividum]